MASVASVIDYFVVESLDGFFANFNEMGRRISERLEQPERPFSEVCTRHKDNIYAAVPPPAGG